MKLNTVEELVEDIRQGKMVILMDDEDRENEGDLILAAERVTPEAINFMAKHARGLICLTMTEARCEQLNLPLMVQNNNASHGTNFTMSIEAATGVTTGISAADRSRTVQVAVARGAVAEDIVQPGHIFPLKAQSGGVLSRAGHTEAGCDLARMAGYEAASVIVEIMNDDGTMARRPDLEKFAEEHNLKIGTIADLIHHRMMHEQTIVRQTDTYVNTAYGELRMVSYLDGLTEDVHVALVKGSITGDQPTTVRVHIPDLMRDLVKSSDATSKSWSLDAALGHIAELDEAGVVVILNQKRNPKDLSDSIEYHTSGGKEKSAARGSGTYSTVGTGSQILRDLGVRRIKLLSKPMRFNSLSGFDLEIVDYIDTAQAG